jgi:hypothetical protein
MARSAPGFFSVYLTEFLALARLTSTLEKVFDFWNEVCRKTVFKRGSGFSIGLLAKVRVMHIAECSSHSIIVGTSK